MDKKNQQTELKTRDLSRLFNMNTIFTKLINFAAYLLLIGSIVILTYFSLIDKLGIKIDWTTLGIFSAVSVLLSWVNWNAFYRKQYEKVMEEDIAQQSINKYSIHARYYIAIKDWTDQELQIAIDSFNEEYINKWLRWVEKKTGVPIESKTVVETDPDGKVIIDPETNEPKTRVVKGIKDLPYKGFAYKRLMWRIKHHKYPDSGYSTSMELMSLFSYQDSNLNKRHLAADRHFFIRKSTSKLLSSILLISVGASLVPEIISGNVAAIIIKLIVAIGSLLSAVFMGALSGVKGARMKLSIVEDACVDLEKWANKKPIIAPYIEPVIKTETVEEPKEPTPAEAAEKLFKNSQNL